MTTAPAAPAATSTPAPRPRPGQHFTRTQKWLIAVVTVAVLVIACLGFVGSYSAVTKLAAAKGFGPFAKVFPIGVDAGIVAFLALDLLLTWLRMPFPLLRQGAWALTAATVSFNAAAAWPDPLGVGMHGVIPVLFVIAVEAARHAVGRFADITADKHIELPPWKRWAVAPLPTFRLWRRQIIWGIRSYEEAIVIERQRQVYRARLRAEHGRQWRTKASAEQRLVMKLATRNGLTVAEAIALPKAEALAEAEAEAKRAAEAELLRTRTEAEALRIRTQAEAEAEAKRRAEAEANLEAEAKRAETEAALRAEAKRQAEADRILEDETEAKLAAIARQQKAADLEAEAARQRYLEEQEARRAQVQHEAAQRRAREAEAALRAETEAEALRARAAATAEAKRIAAAATRTEPTPPNRPKPKHADPKPAANLGGARGKKQAEVEAILARITAAADPKAVGLEDVKADFGLRHAAAWDRLSTARSLWASAQKQSA